MADESYQPISCALHSELELAAMHRKAVKLRLRDGTVREGIIEDLWTAHGREWLRLRQKDGSCNLDLGQLAHLDNR